MSLKLKIILIFLSVFLAYGLVNFGIQRFVIFPSFLALERDEAIKNVNRSVQAIKREIHHLDNLCWDWASWDDTYEFIKSRSNKYIEANLILSTFIDNKINVICFIDTKGRIFWSEARDSETGKMLRLTGFPNDRFPSHHPLIAYMADNKIGSELNGVKGVYITDRGPLMISSRPILTSDNKGPAKGALIFGRFLSDQIIKTIIGQTQVPIEIYSIANGVTPKPVEDIRRRINDESLLYWVETANTGHVNSYTAFPDIMGDTSFLIKAITPANISSKGHATINYAMYSVILAGVFMLFVMLLIIHYSVLEPIISLTNHVRTIEQSGDINTASAIHRHDEVGILAKAFNSMVRQIDKYRAGLEKKVEERTLQLSSTNERLRQEIEEHTKTANALHAEHERFVTVMDSLDATVYAADMETHKLLFINKHLSQSIGDVDGKICWESIQDGQTGPCAFCTNDKLVDADGKPTGTYVWEFQNTRNGKWYQCRDQAIRWPDGRLTRIEIATDITALKRAEAQIVASLKEKEVLLREIHHRVKNNMQSIVSLLRIHARRTNDARLGRIFDECRDSINAMSLIHETLYQSEDLARIDFENYLKKLCRSLSHAHGASGKGIEVTVEQCSVSPNMDQSIAVGMVICELIANAFQHAFPSGKGGNVSVSLCGLKGDQVELIVSDDGKGLPPEIDIENSPSLGLQLAVATVTRELDGSIRAERNGGTRFIIRFNCKSV